MTTKYKSICVFCASSLGNDPAFVQAANTVGTALAQSHITLIYGGGCIGLMGTVADAALAAGGKVIGVIPKPLMTLEVGHRSLTELRVVSSMHERKQMMADLSDAFIALPGGFGTLEELAEILTWSQLGIHNKPVGLLNVSEFYTPLLTFLNHMTSAALLKQKNRDLLLAAETYEALMGQMEAWKPEYHPKWITEKQT
jgi:uncharacterized protein (TIGR00730 family)